MNTMCELTPEQRGFCAVCAAYVSPSDPCGKSEPPADSSKAPYPPRDQSIMRTKPSSFTDSHWPYTPLSPELGRPARSVDPARGSHGVCHQFWAPRPTSKVPRSGALDRTPSMLSRVLAILVATVCDRRRPNKRLESVARPLAQVRRERWNQGTDHTQFITSLWRPVRSRCPSHLCIPPIR